MSHKVHPKIFRIKETKDWLSRWVGKKLYAKTLEEDFYIREFLEKKLKDASLESIEIERFVGRITIILNSGRPGLIIGRGGSGIEILKKGRLPLQTIRSIVDYALVEAQTTYGTVGVKVWLYKGEKFD